MAALQGKTIKEYALERLFPAAAGEEQAWADLKTLVEQRIAERPARALSSKTFDEIVNEELRAGRAGLNAAFVFHPAAKALRTRACSKPGLLQGGHDLLLQDFLGLSGPESGRQPCRRRRSRRFPAHRRRQNRWPSCRSSPSRWRGTDCHRLRGTGARLRACPCN